MADLSALDAVCQKVFTDLQTGFVSGDEKDSESVYVCLKRAMIAGQKCILLMTIFVPFKWRNQKVCSRIITFLEERADLQDAYFAVGPIISDENNTAFVGDHCRRKGYQVCHPWTYVRLKKKQQDMLPQR